MTTRLTRSRRDKVIAGVCGGLAEYFEVDPTLVRLIFVVLLFSGGLAVPLYVVLWIVMPKERRPDWNAFGSTTEYQPFRQWDARNATGTTAAPTGATEAAGATGAAAAGAPGATASTFAGAATGAGTAGPGTTGGPPPTGADPFAGGFGPSPFSMPNDAPAGGPETPPFGPYPWIEDDLNRGKDRRRPALLAVLLIGAGLLLLAYNLNLLGQIKWGVVWPAMLIVLGLALLLGKRGRRRRW